MNYRAFHKECGRPVEVLGGGRFFCRPCKRHVADRDIYSKPAHQFAKQEGSFVKRAFVVVVVIPLAFVGTWLIVGYDWLRKKTRRTA